MKEIRAYGLRGADIDAFSEQLESSLSELGIERQNRLRIRLSMEEALLRLRDRFGESAQIDTEIATLFGKLHIQISLEGDPYNPLSKTESELDDWNGPLLSSVGMNLQYNYVGNRNVLRLNLPFGQVNPALMTLLSVGIGVLAGILVELLLPESMQNGATELLFEPIYTVWRRILNTIAGPVIFFMVTTAVLNMKKVTEQGGNSRAAVLRYFRASLLFTFLAAVIAAVCFGVSARPAATASEKINPYLEGIQEAIPNDIVTPFMDSNTPQLLIMAIEVGAALNVIGIQARNLSRIIKQMNMVGLLIAEWVGHLSPIVILVLVALEIWEERTRMIFGVLICCVLSVVLSALTMAVAVLYVSRKKNVGFRILVDKLKLPFFLALRKGSVEAAYGQTEHTCVTALGTERNFTSISLPHGLIFFMPATAIGTVIYTVYIAAFYDANISLGWFMIAVVMTVVLTAASPPIQGAGLLAYIAIFSQMGVPSEALVNAAFFDLIFGIYAAAANQTLLQLELILQADSLGLLNVKRLRAPSQQYPSAASAPRS